MNEPQINDHHFVNFLQAGQLKGSQCTACNEVFVPARGLCPHCQQADLQWIPMAGTGRLLAFTCITIGPPWMIAQGYDRETPYCSAVIELDEGPRVVARLDGVDAQHPETISVGMRVETKFRSPTDDEEAPTQLIFVPS